ncbi:MAG: porin family protein [Candidatus Pacearchaeota archaeon]|nr:porin family protein [Candidatus Pacearchaeota archaeon]
MSCYMYRFTTRVAFVLSCSLATALPVMAETGLDSDHWEFVGSAYLWAAGVEGTSAAGDEIDVSFSDLLENLDGGVMGVLAAQKGRWTLIADAIYLSIHQETSSTANLIGIPARIDTDMELKGFVTTFGAAYRVIEDDTTILDLLAGARYFKLDVDFDADVAARKTKYSDSGDALDGIVGAQAIINLNERWYVSLYADVGAGDSKRTWQAGPGVGYRLEDVDVVAGYRHLEWETDDGDTFDDLNFSGPMIGVKFRF